MKKHKNLLITFFILIIILLPQKINAASGYYSIDSNSSVTEGSNIKVTFTMSSKSIFYWQAYITYDTSRLKLISGSTNFKGNIGTGAGKNSISQTLTFTAKKTGNAWVKISPDSNGDYNINTDGERISLSSKSKTITVKEKIIKTYSSNNYLKSLSIDGYSLSPKFSKDTEEYSLEVPAETKKININASKEDSTSKIEGIGERELTEGTNKLVIKVIAENGNTREYKINITVKELDPINVKINDKEYSVIRKEKDLPIPISNIYTKTTTKINGNDVPALYSEITKYTLVGLKDENGNINLYIYDLNNNSYTEYNEITFNKIIVQPINKEIKNNDFKKTTISFEEKEVVVYKNIKNPQYSIFYGINIETGEENIYMYDSKENTIQRYFDFKSNNILGLSTSINIGNNLYLCIIIGLSSILILTYIIILCVVIKKNKKTRTNITHNNVKKEKNNN